MKRSMTAAWLSAAVCAVLMTGCGDSSSANGAADAGTGTRRPAVSHETTTATTTAVTSTTTRSETTETAHTTTERDLLDRAESALDSIGDAVTSVLTEATRPVGNGR